MEYTVVIQIFKECDGRNM